MTKKQHNPLYAMLKEKLLLQIQSEEYKVGDRLPTESELCDQYQVSRTTVRYALQELEREGILERIQGSGTFVKRKELQLLATRSFSEDISAQGKKPSNKVLEAVVVPADSPLAGVLGIPLESPVTKLVRLRFADNEPLIYETSYIPWSLAPGLALNHDEGSLFSLIQSRYQLQIHRSVEKLKPVLADKQVAKLLNIPEGSPCFEVQTITYLTDNTPLEYNYGIFRGDFPNFTIERFY